MMIVMNSVGVSAIVLLVYTLMRQSHAFITREVMVKESVTFPCSCSGKCPVVEWSRFIPSETIMAEWTCLSGQSFHERSTISGDTSRGDFSLVISPVIYNDAGSYRCSCNGETVLEVKMKVLVGTVIKALEGLDVTLPCYGDTRRDDVKDVQWKKDGQMVVLYTHAHRSLTPDEGENRFTMSVEGFRDGDLSLHITSVHRSDTGVYRCLIHDESQDGDPSTVVLQVEALQHQSTTANTTIIIIRSSCTGITVLCVLLGLIIAVGICIGLIVWNARRHRDHTALPPQP